MSFSSDDNLLTCITSGQYLRREASKLLNPVATAYGWHMGCLEAGYPTLSTLPATQDLVWHACDETYGDGTNVIGMNTGGNLAAFGDGLATRHVLNVGGAVIAAAGNPWQLKLVDLIGYYKMSSTNVTGTSSRVCVNGDTYTASSGAGSNLLLTYTNDYPTGTMVQVVTTGALPGNLSLLTNYWLARQSATTAFIASSYANLIAGTYIAYSSAGTPTNTFHVFPARYTNGVGLQAFFVAQTAPSTGGPNLTASAYDNTTAAFGAGTSAFQGSVVMNAAANAYTGRVLHSGSAAGNYGCFLPLSNGDLGIARVNSFTWSGGTAYTGAGVTHLCLVKPLLDLCIPTSGMWCERDLRNQLPSMPQIMDGACLVWMIFGAGATSANSPMNTTIDFAYGG